MQQVKWVYNGVEFNEGDTVMVVSVAESFQFNAMGDNEEWNNTWITEMDEAIFLEFEIEFIDEDGVHFVERVDVPASLYSYPLSVLRNLTAEMKEAA